jgi:hypothetical protein
MDARSIRLRQLPFAPFRGSRRITRAGRIRMADSVLVSIQYPMDLDVGEANGNLMPGPILHSLQLWFA